MAELVGNVLVGQSGGPTSVINASLAGIVAEALNNESIEEIYGGLNGVLGILQEDIVDLASESQQQIRALRHTPGAALGTCRYKLKKQQDFERVIEVFKAHNIRYFFYIGGNDSQDTADKISKMAQQQGYELRVIGVPKTIDNDLGGTDVTFGFDTALHIATEAIDRLHTTAESHNRILVVEVMGRTAGWIALHSGVAGGADVILIPEVPFDIDEVCRLIRRRHARGRYFSIVVAAEGATPKEGTMPVAETGSFDEFGHPRLGGIGYALEREIENRTGYETRATVLGHVQRGGTPTAFDRVLATRLGLAAIDAVHAGQWGMMAALHSTKVEMVALADAVAQVRHVPVEEYEHFDVLFG
jgi:ATP-dependent phosphofructokinase / diphosphate-dependent phosphofructokinase